MTIQTINVGSAPNDGNGDSLRTAFITINNNFSYLGNVTGSNGNLSANSLFSSGDITALGNMYVGYGANALPVVNPIFVGIDSGGGYVQTVIKNTAANASADITAFSDVGSDSAGWISTGITASGFNDPTYTITGNVDGYLFHQGYPGYGGNLVLSTGEKGTYADIVFSVGGFTSNKEVMRFSQSGQNLQIKTNTKSTSTSSGALVVSGGAGVAGNAYIGGNLTSGNLSTTAISATSISTTTLSGTLTTGAQPNITSLGTISSNLSIISNAFIQSDTPGINSFSIRDLFKTTRTVYNSSNANVGATDSLSFDIGNTNAQFGFRGINVNVTWSYSSTINPGYVTYLALQNLSGATRQIVLPNSNNNKGSNTIIIANGITASFTFTAFDTTAANVVVFIANN